MNVLERSCEVPVFADNSAADHVKLQALFKTPALATEVIRVLIFTPLVDFCGIEVCDRVQEK